jgi:3-hydroxyacyl-[acyl-carrier-protein] dehydratase
MNIETLSYLPQRAPFVMIDEVISADETHTQTSFTITADNLFLRNGCFAEPGLIENMAQTAGAGTGYMAKKAGKPTPMGYIAALRNVNIISLPMVNENIITKVVYEQKILNFHQAKAWVMAGDREIATSEFKIFVPTASPV